MNLRCRNALVLLLGALVLGCEASVDQSALRGSDERLEAVQEPNGERRLMSFWSFLFLLGPHPCPPGPLGDHCRHEHDSEHTDGDSGTDSSTSSAASDDGGDGQVQSSSSSSGEDGSSGSSGNDDVFTTGLRKSSFAMMIVAGVAASAALVAAIVGQRRDKADKHQLTGSIARRVGLFSALADGSLCSGVERPERVVQSGDYQMT